MEPKRLQRQVVHDTRSAKKLGEGHPPKQLLGSLGFDRIDQSPAVFQRPCDWAVLGVSGHQVRRTTARDFQIDDRGQRESTLPHLRL